MVARVGVRGDTTIALTGEEGAEVVHVAFQRALARGTEQYRVAVYSTVHQVADDSLHDRILYFCCRVCGLIIVMRITVF